MSSTHNLSKWTRQILKRYRKSSPSLTLHLFETYFRFEQQNGVFLFESPMRCFFEYVREQRLPSDLLGIFDAAGVKFYEGCLIVQVHDHRDMSDASKTCKQPTMPRPTSTWGIASLQRNATNAIMNTTATSSKHPELYRIVLGPSIETLWMDLNQMWEMTEEQATEVEARILALTQPSICLDPSFEVTAIANHALRTTSLSCPESGRGEGVANGRKRRTQSNVSEEEERRLAKRERLMRSMDETLDRPFAPTFARLGFVEQWREEQERKKSSDGKTATASPAPAKAAAPATNARPTHPLAQSHLPSSNPPAKKKRPTSRAGSEAASPPPTNSAPLKKSTTSDKATRGGKGSKPRGRGGARVKNMPPPNNAHNIPIPSAGTAPTLADLPPPSGYPNWPAQR